MRTSLQSSFYTIDKALNGPSLAATIAVFVWCLMFHVISSIPQPGIYSEGYNHGGIFIDFIGQVPRSKITLILIDVLILALQLCLVELKTLTPENEYGAIADMEGLSEITSLPCRIGESVISTYKQMRQDLG